MEKDQIKQLSSEESVDEWSCKDEEELSVSQSEFDLSNKKMDLKQEKAKRQRKLRRNKRYNNSIWNLKESILYMNFLKENASLFDFDKKKRRIMKINVILSTAVRTRSSDQCRSHHQKMIKYHKTIEGIIQHIEMLQQKLRIHNYTSQHQDQIILDVKPYENAGLMKEDILGLQDYKADSLMGDGIWWDGLSI